LSLAEFCYNTSFHSALRLAPFEALYGYSPKHFAIPDMPSSISSVEQWLQERKVQQELIKQHLHRATLRMKHQADKGWTERQIKVGDMIFLKIQPYVQSSLAPGLINPYVINERIGSVAYKLDLPPSATIHLVLHVS
jgi:hypothetical protein